jgi:hypothetical protein
MASIKAWTAASSSLNTAAIRSSRVIFPPIGSASTRRMALLSAISSMVRRDLLALGLGCRQARLGFLAKVVTRRGTLRPYPLHGLVEIVERPLVLLGRLARPWSAATAHHGDIDRRWRPKHRSPGCFDEEADA